VGSTTRTGGASRVIVGARTVAEAGPVRIPGQLKLAASVAGRVGIEGAGVVDRRRGSVIVRCGRTGAGGQVSSGGLMVEGSSSTSGAEEDAGIDRSADDGVGVDEEAAWNTEVTLAFAGNDQTDFAGGGVASTSGAAFFAASAAAAAPNPFHVPVEGVEDPIGL
jgi:hypothetical protein